MIDEEELEETPKVEVEEAWQSAYVRSHEATFILPFGPEVIATELDAIALRVIDNKIGTLEALIKQENGRWRWVDVAAESPANIVAINKTTERNPS